MVFCWVRKSRPLELMEKNLVDYVKVHFCQAEIQEIVLDPECFT